MTETNDFQAAREGGGGIISDFDHRRLWSTFGKKGDPDQGAILDTVWEKYFDSREKYDRLIASAEELIDGNDDLFWAVMGGSPGNFVV